MKDIIVGLFAIVGVVLGVIVIVAILMLMFYAFGYMTGWVLHLMVGPDIVLGMSFEQFIGLMFVVGGILGGGKSTIEKTQQNEQVKKMTDQIKSYRGY